MPALTPEDSKILRTFGARPEGRLLVRVLQDRLAEIDHRSRRAIGEELYRCQGRGLLIEELLELLGYAVTTPEPVRRPNFEPNRGAGMKLPIVNHMAVD